MVLLNLILLTGQTLYVRLDLAQTVIHAEKETKL